MASIGNPSELPQQLSQIVESAKAVSVLITDLIDFTNSTVGVGSIAARHRPFVPGWIVGWVAGRVVGCCATAPF